MNEKNTSDRKSEISVPIVRLLCDIVRQHPSLLLVVDAPPYQLRAFLLACLSHPSSIDIAMQTLSVWSRIEPELTARRDPDWAQTFHHILLVVLRKWALITSSTSEEHVEKRADFDETVLCCAQVMGETAFFEVLRGAASSVESALWASVAAAVLHDGRTEHCLPELFVSAFALDPATTPQLAATGCQAIVAYRLFIKQYRDGALVEPAARFCGRCLPIAATEAAKALLMLAELCGESMVAGLSFVVPLAARALPVVSEETAFALVSACAELATNLSEEASAPLTAELLDALISGTAVSRRPENFLGAGVALCSRSMGRSGAIYAGRLSRAWPELLAMLGSDQHYESACDFVAALATAAGPACQGMLPSVCQELVSLMQRRGTPRAVVAMRVFVAAASAASALGPLLASTCRAVLDYVGSRATATSATPEASDVCCAYFELLKALLWSPPWCSLLPQAGSPLMASLQLLCTALLQYGHDFECLLALSDFELELVAVSNSKPAFASLLTTVAPPLIGAHLRACLDGNPLAIRFHCHPLYELLRIVPVAQRAQVFAAGLREVRHCLPEPWIGTAARIASSINAARTFKAYMSDLFDVCRGRESADALSSYVASPPP
jgi:hypothetical protein